MFRTVSKIISSSLLLVASLSVFAEGYDAQYAADRAEIQDLQGRYMFAMDWQDAETYAGTFTEDGILDHNGGVEHGREEIADAIRGMRAGLAKKEDADSPLRPARRRHNITNVVLDIQGDRATGLAYWTEINNDGRDRWPYLGGYGHYEDELQKVNGQWLFSKRKIYNEQLDSRAGSAKNPAW